MGANEHEKPAHTEITNYIYAFCTHVLASSVVDIIIISP